MRPTRRKFSIFITLAVALAFVVTGIANDDRSTPRTDRVRAILVGEERVGVKQTQQPGTTCPVEETCRPTERNRPVCGRGAPPECATFIDPTVKITNPENISLGQRVYIAPFARLLADENAGITIRAESDAQDNVTIIANANRDDDDDDDDDADDEDGDDDDESDDGSGDANRDEQIARLGLNETDGVLVGERVVLSHGVTVKGPARIGADTLDAPSAPNDDGVFIGFGSEVDGAIIERNSGISLRGRVGPGVRLPSGFVVLPGRNVTTQEQAQNPALGKVRLINAADLAFNEAVVEVNTALAREYSRLFYDNPSNVRGINFDPGNTQFNLTRDLPRFAGLPRREPSYRNRIIGDIDLEDSRSQFDDVAGDRVSLRADEGEPFRVGRIRFMRDDVIFHALEDSGLELGRNISYGEAVILHGGLAFADNPFTPESLIVEDDVTFKNESIIFRGFIGAGSMIGFRSVVGSSRLLPGTVIPDRTVFINNMNAGRVEW